jgi:CDP-diacylglycerol--inositol 3-phosphatidyltransferase
MGPKKRSSSPKRSSSSSSSSSSILIKKRKLSSLDVLLFYPNIIGYIRIILMILSFYYMYLSSYDIDNKKKSSGAWKNALICYMIAFIGDVVDGYVARLFNQSSTFGGVLDMVTDRVSTCGFLAFLPLFYGRRMGFIVVMLIVLDISSHWFHVMSVSSHHKSKEALAHRNVFLRWYYGIYPLFGYCCVGTELFYVLSYVIHKDHLPLEWIKNLCYYGCLPACIMKQFVNLVQLVSAMDAIAQRDADMRNDKK